MLNPVIFFFHASFSSFILVEFIHSELAITPLPEEPLWVLHESDMAERSLPWKPDQGFDLYIDQVRFLPDNATIVKVRGFKHVKLLLCLVLCLCISEIETENSQ